MLLILFMEQEGSNLFNAEKQPNLQTMFLDPCLVYLHRRTTTRWAREGVHTIPASRWGRSFEQHWACECQGRDSQYASKTLHNSSAQVGSLAPPTESCGQLNVNHMAPEMYLSRYNFNQSTGKSSILHKSIFLSQELYHDCCKGLSYSSQAVTILPSHHNTETKVPSLHRSRQLGKLTRRRAEKHACVSVNSHNACPKGNY